jgi:hypothetical protein
VTIEKRVEQSMQIVNGTGRLCRPTPDLERHGPCSGRALFY